MRIHKHELWLQTMVQTVLKHDPRTDSSKTGYSDRWEWTTLGTTYTGLSSSSHQSSDSAKANPSRTGCITAPPRQVSLSERFKGAIEQLCECSYTRQNVGCFLAHHIHRYKVLMTPVLSCPVPDFDYLPRVTDSPPQLHGRGASFLELLRYF